VVIVVLGVTGSGKSTFISTLTEHDTGISHGLTSCEYSTESEYDNKNPNEAPVY
jgi:adenylate kinase family enzyme